MGWNEPYVHREVVEIATERDTINLGRRYHPGQGDITVYVNGMYAVIGRDYEESSPWSLRFMNTLYPGDNVVVHYQKLW